MPLQDGQYVAPTFVNDSAPALNADEMNAMAQAVEGAVEYDRAMNLTEEQKAQAAENIGALRSGAQTLTPEEQAQALENMAGLSYNAQTLTDAQKSQAATNMGFVSTDVSQSLTSTQKATARGNISAMQASGSTVTVSASAWNGSSAPYTATAYVSGVTPINNIVVGIGSSATSAQYAAFLDGQIICSAQGNGYIQLTAFGTKPTTTLPISVLVFL